MHKKILTSLIQMNSTADLDRNLEEYLSKLNKALSYGSKFILSPEVTNFITTDHEKRLKIADSLESDIFIKETKSFCLKNSVWVLIGSLVMRSQSTSKCANSSILIDPKGEIKCKYDKIHMFDVNLSEKQKFTESKFYQKGDTAKLAKTEIGNIGLTVCYDVRFPNLYQQLAASGAHIITIPSAFTKFTGNLHWEVLLRSRAIETGCFILAPAQTGIHGQKGSRESFGHSMIVSPWGEVLNSLGSETGLCTAEIDLSICNEFRSKIPNLQNMQRFSLQIN
jgi:predicted amidohydrolase